MANRGAYPIDGVIYGLSCVCHPEKGVRYVGLTTRTAAHRLRGHLNTSHVSDRLPVSRWIRKHGELNIHQEVLEECNDLASLKLSEIAWIEKLGTFGRTGLNLTRGGEGQLGRVPTAEQRERLSLAHMGQERTEEVRLKIGNANLGVKNDLAKLTEIDVDNIKIMLREGIRGKLIAKLLNVTPATIAGINTGKTWRHVPWPDIGASHKPGSLGGRKDSHDFFEKIVDDSTKERVA